MSLRVRLILALSYVLLVAIVALEVPLALSLRERVDAEVRSQAEAQADVVAAAAGDLLDPGARAAPARSCGPRATLRGRVLVVDGRRRCSPTAPGPAARARVRRAARDRRRAGRHSARAPVTQRAGTGAAGHRGADPRQRPPAVGAVRITQSVGRSTRRPTHDRRPRPDRCGGARGRAGRRALIARAIARPMRRLDVRRAAWRTGTSRRAPQWRAAPSSARWRGRSTT